MKTFLWLAMVIMSMNAHAATTLHGEWKFSGLIYHGQVLPPPNPSLNLIWTFFSNGTERLYWDRRGENGFCERFATYNLDGGQISENIFAVNPANNESCSQDPDMQVGRETLNKIEI